MEDLIAVSDMVLLRLMLEIVVDIYENTTALFIGSKTGTMSVDVHRVIISRLHVYENLHFRPFGSTSQRRKRSHEHGRRCRR